MRGRSRCRHIRYITLVQRVPPNNESICSVLFVLSHEKHDALGRKKNSVKTDTAAYNKVTAYNNLQHE